MNLLWKNDAVQFARLLSELVATQADLDLHALCASMDLTWEEVQELFERANTAWERAKNAYKCGHNQTCEVTIDTSVGPYFLMGGLDPTNSSVASFAPASFDNDATDALDSLILAHFCAGVDVTAPAYIEGLNTTIDAIANHIDDDDDAE